MGKVRAIINDQGKQIDSAEPSTPIEILGINGAAKSGDDFIVLKLKKMLNLYLMAEYKRQKRAKIHCPLLLKTLLLKTRYLKN